MQLLLIRHGRTEWNQLGIIQGGLDSPLTESARLQLASLELDSWRGVPIFSSDLRRSYESAQLIAKRNGNPITVDSRMRERSFGVLEGKTIDSEGDEARWQAYHNRFRQKLRLPGVEPEGIFEARIRDFVDELLCFKQERVILVGHGEWLRACLNILQNIPCWHKGNGIPNNATAVGPIIILTA